MVQNDVSPIHAPYNVMARPAKVPLTTDSLCTCRHWWDWIKATRDNIRVTTAIANKYSTCKTSMSCGQALSVPLKMNGPLNGQVDTQCAD